MYIIIRNILLFFIIFAGNYFDETNRKDHIDYHYILLYLLIINLLVDNKLLLETDKSIFREFSVILIFLQSVLRSMINHFYSVNFAVVI